MGYIMDRPEGSPQLPGILLIKPLVERLKTCSIKVLPGLVIFDLIVEEGEVCGALGFLRNGNPCLILSRAVVLATGEQGRFTVEMIIRGASSETDMPWPFVQASPFSI